MRTKTVCAGYFLRTKRDVYDVAVKGLNLVPYCTKSRDSAHLFHLFWKMTSDVSVEISANAGNTFDG